MTQFNEEDQNIALFDMDGTLCDYDKAVLRDLKPLMSPEESETTSVHVKHPPHIAARISMIRRVPGWWKKLEPYSLGFDIFKLCQSMGYFNTLLTKGPSTTEPAWTEKVSWRRCHLPGIPLTITEDNDSIVGSGKSRVYGKVLVDDFQEYLSAWLNAHKRGLGIIPVNDGNKHFHHPRVIPATGKNLDIIELALQAAYDREFGQPLVLPSEVIAWVHGYYMDLGVHVTK